VHVFPLNCVVSNVLVPTNSLSRMKVKVLLILLIGLLLHYSCSNSPQKPAGSPAAADSPEHYGSGYSSPESENDFPVNYFSPVEIADLFQKIGVPFSTEYLASPIDPRTLTTSFDKAVTLGILCADLGYMNMYEMTGSFPDLIASIKTLAEDLGVSQFFDFDAITRLSFNKSNMDSLLFLSLTSYSQADHYLRENDLGHLSVLMMTGVWLEGQYLTVKVFEKYSDPKLKDRIGEQKLFLNHLIETIKNYCGKDTQFERLCSDLRKLNDSYTDVRISYTRGEPVATKKGKGLAIQQTETSNVEMSQEQLARIMEASAGLRNNLIKKN